MASSQIDELDVQTARESVSNLDVFTARENCSQVDLRQVLRELDVLTARECDSITSALRDICTARENDSVADIRQALLQELDLTTARESESAHAASHDMRTVRENSSAANIRQLDVSTARECNSTNTATPLDECAKQQQNENTDVRQTSQQLNLLTARECEGIQPASHDMRTVRENSSAADICQLDVTTARECNSTNTATALDECIQQQKNESCNADVRQTLQQLDLLTARERESIHAPSHDMRTVRENSSAADICQAARQIDVSTARECNSTNTATPLDECIEQRQNENSGTADVRQIFQQLDLLTARECESAHAPSHDMRTVRENSSAADIRQALRQLDMLTARESDSSATAVPLDVSTARENCSAANIRQAFLQLDLITARECDSANSAPCDLQTARESSSAEIRQAYRDLDALMAREANQIANEASCEVSTARENPSAADIRQALQQLDVLTARESNSTSTAAPLDGKSSFNVLEVTEPELQAEQSSSFYAVRDLNDLKQRFVSHVNEPYLQSLRPSAAESQYALDQLAEFRALSYPLDSPRCEEAVHPSIKREATHAGGSSYIYHQNEPNVAQLCTAAVQSTENAPPKAVETHSTRLAQLNSSTARGDESNVEMASPSNAETFTSQENSATAAPLDRKSSFHAIESLEPQRPAEESNSFYQYKDLNELKQHGVAHRNEPYFQSLRPSAAESHYAFDQLSEFRALSYPLDSPRCDEAVHPSIRLHHSESNYCVNLPHGGKSSDRQCRNGNGAHGSHF